jgi:Pyruvate/2-oxoacid:ferredoxin oxidoreductase delta subunit
MKVKRKIIEIDEERCDGCGQCAPSCAEGAIEIIDGKARLVAEKYCDGLGACLGECPKDALRIVEREAEEFDEEAVEDYLQDKESEESEQAGTMACGCPSAHLQSFDSASSCRDANQPRTEAHKRSELTHWPVQIRLVPPTAPFLKGADLLVAADCTPIAYPNFHADFIRDKVVMLGCPKFDEQQAYVKKFAEIFRTAGVRSVGVVVMEVPCCQGLPMIVQKGMEISGKKIPMEKIVISTRGEVLNRQRMVA